MNARAGGVRCDFALFKNRKFEAGAEKSFARCFRQLAVGIVDEANGAVRLSQHDEIVLRFEENPGAFLGFLQFPVAVDQCFIALGDDT